MLELFKAIKRAYQHMVIPVSGIAAAICLFISVTNTNYGNYLFIPTLVGAVFFLLVALVKADTPLEKR